MEVNITCNTKLLPIEILKRVQLTELQPGTLPAIKSIHSELDTVLEKPTGSKPFAALLGLKQPNSIAIAVPDHMSLVPVKEILSSLLDCIFKALPTIEASCVRVIVGSGPQALPDINEYNHILASPIALGCDVSVHNPMTSEMVDFGITRFGTPVRVNRSFADAEFKICIGQIAPHQIIGFTGAAEEATIGCAANETLEFAFGLMFDDNVRVGKIEKNPVRENLDEAGRMIGLDFAINVVLDVDQTVVRLFAGHPDHVLRQGAKICAEVCGVKTARKFDIVVVCCGDGLKNKKKYHLEKIFNLIAQVIKKGGKILLLTGSQQRMGDELCFDYVCHEANPEKTLDAFKNFECQMGSQNAYLLGKTNTDYDLNLQFDLDSKMLSSCHLRAADRTTIIKEWIDNYEKKPDLAIIANTNIYIKS